MFAELEIEDLTKWVTKSDRAYGVIRQAILQGTLEPDEQINPKLIATELGMSIIPVREALKRLEQDGLVVIRPHVGAAVREMPYEKIAENLLVRSALESLAAELATPLMTNEVLENLEELISRMEQYLAEDHTERFGALNRQFHMTIYGVIAEKSLIGLIEQQWDQVPRGAAVFALAPKHAFIAHEEHLEILDALKRGEAKEAARLTREHKLRARQVHAAVHHGSEDRQADLVL